MQAKYKIALFDFDGTIINSAPGIIRSIKYAQEKMGMDFFPEEKQYNRFIGPPLKYSFKNFCGLSEDEAEEAVRLYRENYETNGVYECSFYEGMPELLRDLRYDGVKTAVASAKPEKFIRKIVRYFNAEDCFDAITGSTPDGSIGDKDVLIRMAYEKLRENEIPLEKSGAVMVGDRVYDAVGARKTGIDFIGVLFGFGSAEEFLNEGYSNIAKNTDEIRKYIYC